MKRDRLIEQTILIEDLILTIGALLLARFLHERLTMAIPGLKPPVAPGEYAHLLLIFLPTWTFAAEKLGIHWLRTLSGDGLEIVRRVILTQAWGIAAIGLILTAAQVSLNRSLILTFLVVSTAMLLVAKVFQSQWVRRYRGQSRLLLIGETSGDLSSELARRRGRLVEHFDGADPAALRDRFRAGPVDEVVLGGGLPAPVARALVEACTEAGLPVFIPIAEPALSLPPPDIETVGNDHYAVYQPHEIEALPHAAKVVLDRVLAVVLIVLLTPLMLLVALAARIFIGPSVLFVQPRGGLHGKPFPMLKFRTMHLGAENERITPDGLSPLEVFGGLKARNDPRITRFGHILRRTSLDELPQLFNVLVGHMSIVGPRPLPLEETEALAGGNRRRLSMRPGLTCLWQISGRSDLPFPQRMALDLEYVDRWSLGLDLAIILRTLPAIISGRGAR
jgi:lipopolysaccharide/colanic/teichoic acid biosynthesis glycosyltransferase